VGHRYRDVSGPNPKSEIRGPKETRSPKSERVRPLFGRLGDRISFGPRISDLIYVIKVTTRSTKLGGCSMARSLSR
jgi:hypothetical protein